MVSSLTLSPSLAERYTVLLDLARTLTSTLDPGALYPSVHAQVARVLPTSNFVIALAGAGGRIAPVFHMGPGSGELPLSPPELDNLRAGDYVLRPVEDGAGWLLVAPLVREERLLGWIGAERREGGGFDMADAHFLLAVGRLAGVALDNARLFAEARRRGEEAERLEAIARDLSESLELSEVVDRVAVRAHELVTKPVVVWILEDNRARAVARAGGALISLGEERALPPAAIARLKASAPGAPEAMHAGAELAAAKASAEGNRILVPLVLGERLAGFLAVGPWGDDAPDPERLDLLHRMASHAASAVENARLHEEVRRLSLTDPLVQLPNRRQLDLFLEKEFAAAERGRPLCFVLYDLDRFKRFNDTHGHRAGDVALIRFADVLRTETRSMNLAARYGGEEFAAVLSSTSLAGGRAYAERVRRRVFEVFAGELSVSAGAAEYRPGMESPIDLVVAADRALYRAKLDGRNRVYVADG